MFVDDAAILLVMDVILSITAVCLNVAYNLSKSMLFPKLVTVVLKSYMNPRHSVIVHIHDSVA